MKLEVLKDGFRHQVLIDDCDLGLIAGYNWSILKRDGYAVASGGVRMHRLIAGAGEDEIVDHIDGNRLNNQRANLRICGKVQNGQNQKLHRNNTTGFKGVSVQHYKTGPVYVASIRDNRTMRRLGRFNCPINAAKAYDRAALEYHGAFAVTNKDLGLIP